MLALIVFANNLLHSVLYYPEAMILIPPSVISHWYVALHFDQVSMDF